MLLKNKIKKNKQLNQCMETNLKSLIHLKIMSIILFNLNANLNCNFKAKIYIL